MLLQFEISQLLVCSGALEIVDPLAQFRHFCMVKLLSQLFVFALVTFDQPFGGI